MDKKKAKAEVMARREKQYVYENDIIACTTCLSRFKARLLSPAKGAVIECPVCGMGVRVGDRNRVVVSVEATDDVDED